MQVINHRAGSVTLPTVDGHTETVPGRKTVEVSDAYWQAIKDNPAVVAWVAGGKLSVGDSSEGEATAKAKAKAESKPAESKPKDPEPAKEPAPQGSAKPIHEMTVADAKPVIAAMTDPDELSQLAEKDQRQGIRDAVDARLEELTAPEG